MRRRDFSRHVVPRLCGHSRRERIHQRKMRRIAFVNSAGEISRNSGAAHRHDRAFFEELSRHFFLLKRGGGGGVGGGGVAYVEGPKPRV